MNKDEKGYWLIDPNKHNEAVQEGCKYLIPLDYEWEGVSPFRGLTCTVLQISTYSKAGFDCFVKLDVAPDELAYRYRVARGSLVSEKDVIEWHGEDNFHTDGFKYEPGLYVEHDTEYLTPLIDTVLDQLDREYAQAINKLGDARAAMKLVVHHALRLGDTAEHYSTQREAKSLYYSTHILVAEVSKLENELANVVIDTSYRADQEIK